MSSNEAPEEAQADAEGPDHAHGEPARFRPERMTRTSPRRMHSANSAFKSVLQPAHLCRDSRRSSSSSWSRWLCRSPGRMRCTAWRRRRAVSRQAEAVVQNHAARWRRDPSRRSSSPSCCCSSARHCSACSRCADCAPWISHRAAQHRTACWFGRASTLGLLLGRETWFRRWENRITFVIVAHGRLRAGRLVRTDAGDPRAASTLIPGKNVFNLWELLKGLVA